MVANPREAATSRVAATGKAGARLDDIMNFIPLKDAFREFCRKALCSEV